MQEQYQNRLLSDIVEHKLCSGCGTCAGVCPRDCIAFDTSSHTPIVKTENCINCGLCYKVCPGKGYNFNKLKEISDNWDEKIGPYEYFVVCSSNDEKIKELGASGGTVSTILKYCLEKKLVDRVLCVTKKGGKFCASITDSVETMLRGQGSKYIPVPLNIALKNIVRNKWKIALVGTPCHIQGVNNASEYILDINKYVAYKIGLFCGFVQSEEALNALKRYLKINDNDWSFDGWRCGDYPGYVQFTNCKSGETRKLLIYEALNIAIPFYSLEKCFMCPDGTNSGADIALGDIHSRGHNENCGIVRTKTGKLLVEAMVDSGYLHCTQISYEDAMKNTVGSVSYLKHMRSLLYINSSNKLTPDYDIKINKKHYKKYVLIQNRIQIFLYRFLRKKAMLKFMEKHPQLQMKVGRYIYCFPNYSLTFRVVLKIYKMIKRK